MLRFFKNNPFAAMLVFIMLAQTIMNGQMSDPMAWLMSKLIILPAIIIGLSFHEFAHAFAADRLGDNTPKFQGRVTMNPAAHIDPIGIIALFFIGFGWGRPVQVNPMNFKNIRRDSLIVDLAGITTNLVLAILFAGVLKLLYVFQLDFMLSSTTGNILTEMIMAIVSINIVLMVFNLLPIPPLDGFGVVTEVFNLREKEIYYQIYDKGFVILMVLIIFNITDKILFPTVNFILDVIMGMFF